MKTPSDELFKFIKTFSAHEKAFIKRSLSSYKQNTGNEKMVDYLSACEQYDEKTLVAKLTFVNASNVKHHKQNLFSFLFHKLEQYYSDSNQEKQTYKLLLQARILRQKSIFDKAQRLLATAIEKSKKFGLYLLQIQLMQEQEFIAIERSNLHEYNLLKNNKVNELPKLLKYFQEDNRCNELLHELNIFNIVNKSISKTELLQQKQHIYKKIKAQQKEATNKKFPNELLLKYEWLEFYSLMQLGDFKKARFCFKKYKRNYERAGLVSVDPERYFTLLYNGIGLSIYSHDKTLFSLLVNQADGVFRALLPKRKNTSLLNKYYVVKLNEIAFFTHTHQFDVAKRMSEEVEKEILSNGTIVATKKVFLSNLTDIYLCTGEPRKALKYYHEMTNNIELGKVRGDINDTSAIMALAIYYDLNFESNMKSVLRHCFRDKAFQQQSIIYRELIHFFSVLTKSKSNEKRLFQNILKTADKLLKTDNESALFLENIQIRYWLKNKCIVDSKT